MINTKLSEDKKVPIVLKVSIADTLLGIPRGEEVHFSRKDLGFRDGTVRQTVTRLNHKAGRHEFAVRLDDGDGSYWIRRK